MCILKNVLNCWWEGSEENYSPEAIERWRNKRPADSEHVFLDGFFAGRAGR